MSKSSKDIQRQSKLILEELEERRLFSGGIEGLIDPSLDSDANAIYSDINGSSAQTNNSGTDAAAAEQQSQEVVFVDADVDNYQQLVDDLTKNEDGSRNIEVVVLDQDKDGIEEISEFLSTRDELDAVHIISHGDDGSIQLGNTELNADTLEQNNLKIALWANSFAETGDILIYGCNLAETVDGQDLINDISSLTLADVAASTDLTGHAGLGGDWALEFSVGEIESKVAVSAELQQEYQGTFATYTVTSLNDSGAGSLREAIGLANTSGGADTIEFGVAGTISLSSALPTIGEQLAIDGSTAPGYSGDPVVEIDGTGVSGNGLRFTSGADDSSVNALMITNFTGNGIQIDNGADGIAITGNWIGTTGTGTTGDGNSNNGINVQGANTVIGGTGANDGNVITNNGNEGINLTGTGATGTLIQGNIIGLDPDGSTGTGNGDVGIALLSGSHNTTIGGTDPNARNIISMNFEGIEINSNNNTIQGNYIGTDITGTQNRGNDSDDGIEIQNNATGNLIGGTEEGAGNLIAFNQLDGVNIVSGSGNTLLGNEIHSNGDQDIDIAGGANDSLSAPVLSAAGATPSQITINGTLVAAANDFYRIEFFATSGGVQTYIGFANVATDGSGNAVINATLNASVAADATITATATDTDAGYAIFGSSSVLSTGVSVNAAPVNNLPAAQSTDVDTTLTFSVANGNPVSIGNDSGAITTVELSVANGTLTLAQTTGLTIDAGADGSATMTVTGTVEDINAALDGLQYTPTTSYVGSDTLTVVSSEDGTQILDIDSNLLGRYQFEAAAPGGDDSPGGTNGATLFGDAAITTDPQRGDVLSLDGSGDYTEITGLYGEPANITLSAWVDLTGTSRGEVINIGDRVILRADDWFGAGVKASFYNGSGFSQIESGQLISGTGWHHLAFSFDDVANMQTLYIDGVAVTTQNYTDSIDYTGGQADTRIGRSFSNFSPIYFEGSIDDARIYDRSLTASEIADLAAERTSDSDSVAITVNAVNDAPTFGIGDGTQTTDVNSGKDQPYATALQSDGKIVTVGFAQNGGQFEFAVTRYNPDGTLDTSFGGDGIVSTDGGAMGNVATTVAIQNDGKIVVAGSTGDGLSDDFAVLRYNSDGTPDTTFDGDGMVTTSFSAGLDQAYSIQIQPGGEILVLGTSSNGTELTMARYNADGSLDTSFDGDGKLTASFPAGLQNPDSVLLQSDGKILVSGTQYVVDHHQLALARFDANGNIDTSFDGDGLATVYVGSGGNDYPGGLTQQADGKILLVGRSWNGTTGDADFSVVRFNTNGSLDTSFSGDGMLTTAIGTGDERAADVVVQPDGKILVAGYSDNGSDNEFAVVRYDANGTLDSSFGTGGQVTTNFGSGDDYVSSIQLQPDGKIVVVGDAGDFAGQDIALVRYNADGTLDDSFAVVNGLYATQTFIEGGAPVVLDSDVTIYDAELSTADNFDGAMLTLVRNGGADAEDVFSATGTLAALTEGGNLDVGGTIIGTVTTNSGGTLVLTFNGNATNALVDSAMQQIAYSNSSNGPPASVQIDWTFDDGDAGGALQALGSTTVEITPVNETPTFIDGAFGNWNFDEGSGDSSAEGAIGISTATLGSTTGADANDPTWTSGVFGQALQFDGVDDYVEVADAPGIDITGPEFSASLWIKPDRGPGTEDMFFMKGDRTGTGNVNYYLSWKDTGKMTWAFKSDGGFEYIDFDVTLPTVDQWNHVAVVFDRPTVSIYINGTEYSSSVATGGTMDKDLVANDDPLWIGAGRDGGNLVTPGNFSAPFSGAIDELALFDRALTAAEIEAIRTSAPPVVTASAFSIDENSANNTVVGTVAAYDPDVGDTLTYAITAGNTNGAFAIDNSGVITVANSAALDFETNPVFTLTVEATDDGSPNLSDTTTVTISLNNLNDAPSQVNNAGLTAAEGAATIITNAQLGYTDTEQPASSVVYTVTSSPANGQLELTTNPGVAITSFTQDDIDNSRVVYAHNGSETVADSFGFSVDDGQGNYASGPSIVGIGPLTNVTNGISNARAPDYSPDGSQVVFSRNNDIYIMNADGSGQTPLVTAVGGDFQAVWSPDGSQIAFTSNRDGNNEIYIIDADGNNETRITTTTNLVSDSAPAWSPDSSKIAFTSDSDGDKEIWVMDADGNNLVQLTTDGGVDGGASWSPDGSKIVFQSTRNGNYDIYVMDANGANQTQLTSDAGLDALGDWSPDGTKLLFYSDRDGNNEIYVMDADGNNQVRLTNDLGDDIEAEWSPDGSSILFTSNRDTDYDVYSANVIYENSFAITVTPVNVAPTDIVVGSTITGGLNLNDDGGNDTYLVADSGLTAPLTQFTFETQFVGNNASSEVPFISYNTGSGDILTINTMANNTLELDIGTGTEVFSSAIDYNAALMDGQPHTLSVSWDNTAGDWAVYIDGALIDSGTGLSVGETIPTGGTLMFGLEQDSVGGGFESQEFFNGTFYDIRLFDDVRTSTEVVNNYDQTLANTEPGMLANWVFDNFSGNGVITETVSGNNLTEQHVVGAGFTSSSPNLTLSIPENASNGTAVGTVSAVDPDAGDTFTYILTDDANGRFDINPTSGEITLIDDSQIDFEAATSHDITVRVSDSGGLTFDKVFTIDVTNVNETPVAVADSITAIEGVPYVAQLTVDDLLLNDSDPDGDTLTVNTTPVSGPTNGSLVLNADGTFTYTPNTDFNGTDAFTYQVLDGNGGTAQATVNITVQPREVRILFSTASDVNNSKVPGVASWDAGEVLGIGDPNLSFEPAGSDGSVLPYMDLEQFSASNNMTLNGLHFVSNDITVGGANSVDLQRGDLLFVSENSETMTSINSLAINAGDVVIFRPTAVDDYSSGTFIHLLDQPGTAMTTGITLIEKDVTIGDVTLSAGGFLFTQESIVEESSIYYHPADDVGAGTTSGTVQTLISSVDMDVNFNNFVGVMVINEDLYLDGTMVPAGSIVTTLAGGDSSVGANGTMINNDEIFYLTVTSTTMGSGSTVANATLLFDGGEIGLNNSAKKMNNLTIIEEITPVNIDPEITLTASALSYTEQNPPTVIDSAATLVDPDSANFDTGVLRVDLTGGTANDRLSINNQGTGGGQVGVSGNTVSYGGITIGTFSGGGSGSEPLVIVLNADATVAAVEALMRNITYENISPNPSTAVRTATFTVTDGDGGSSTPVARNINVSSVNDAPVLSGANDLATINEDAFNNGGTLVSDLISGFVTDTDAGALEGIAVVAVDDTNGTWQFTTDNGANWTAFGSVSANAATLLAAEADTRVRFVPDPGWNGTVSNGITFHAWDQSVGANGDTVDLTLVANVNDQFNAVSYANDDGSAVWTSNWTETNDDAAAATGNVRIESGKLHLDNLDGGSAESITRSADLSAAATATLTFDYDGYGAGALDTVSFEISNDGGSSWTLLENVDIVGNVSDSKSYTLEDFTPLTADMQVRISIVQGFDGVSEQINIDNVDIAYAGPGIDGSGAVSLATASSSISVTSVNNAPTMTEWYNEDWSTRKLLTIDAAQVAGDVTDFPMLITFNTDAELAAQALANGDDIIFSAGDGSTLLAHEIEFFDETTGELRAWVKTDLSASVDNEIYMYFGNASATNQENAAGVWSSNYTGVYHLDQAPDGTAGD
ncbi:DUF2341 domain-containing protein, partial [uncultured Eudoraea sp.]|uniref:DUF2341 domain-containing protein n=1 Tax=uncultured Eudoraea sp. TaxID=1035614 RepID=UPI00261CE8D8